MLIMLLDKAAAAFPDATAAAGLDPCPGPKKEVSEAEDECGLRPLKCEGEGRSILFVFHSECKTVKKLPHSLIVIILDFPRGSKRSLRNPIS